MLLGNSCSSVIGIEFCCLVTVAMFVRLICNRTVVVVMPTR